MEGGRRLTVQAVPHQLARQVAQTQDVFLGRNRKVRHAVRVRDSRLNLGEGDELAFEEVVEEREGLNVLLQASAPTSTANVSKARTSLISPPLGRDGRECGGGRGGQNLHLPGVPPELALADQQLAHLGKYRPDRVLLYPRFGVVVSERHVDRKGRGRQSMQGEDELL